MADLGISEFTFGYSFLHEQTVKKWGRVRSIPIFPSLIKEKRLGYDVNLQFKGKDYYYQFKLSDLLWRSNSKFIRDGTYSGPYYRIKLHRMYFNLQHRKLWGLSRKKKYTYYVSPECPNIGLFNQAFLSGQVTDHSRLIPLTKCSNYPQSDDRQHYITYQRDDPSFIQHSEISKKNDSILGKNIAGLYEEGQKNSEMLDDNFASRVLDDSLTILEDYEEKDASTYDFIKSNKDKLETVYDKLSFSANILWVTLGVAMIIVGEELE